MASSDGFKGGLELGVGLVYGRRDAAVGMAGDGGFEGAFESSVGLDAVHSTSAANKDPGHTGVTALHVREHHPLAAEEFHPLWSVSFTELK